MNLKSTERPEVNVVELVIEVNKDEFDDYINKAYIKNKSKMSVPGFRRGKASRKMIENIYGPSIFYEDAINMACPVAYESAVKLEKLDPVESPDIDIVDISEENGLVFKAKVTVYPEVEIERYKGLAAERKTAEIGEEDIAKELAALQKRNARLVSAERPIKEGDTAVIDYRGLMDGVPFEGGSAEKFSLSIGSNMFIPGFEQSLIGLSAGDEKEIELVFPEDYHKGFAGKPVVFQIKVHEVKENILAELDDEFAKDVSEYNTLDELKKSIGGRLQGALEKKYEQEFEDSLLSQIADNVTAVIPAVMIRRQADGMMKDFRYTLAAQGMDFGDYLRLTGTTEEDFQKRCDADAERRVKTSLAMEKIIELENIEATPEDIDRAIAEMAEGQKMPVEKLREYVNPEEISSSIRYNKAKDIIKSAAVQAKPPQPEAEGSKKARKASVKKAGETQSEGKDVPGEEKKTAKKTKAAPESGEQA